MFVMDESITPRIFLHVYVSFCLVANLITFDEFTMGGLHLLNVAPTHLHHNSWGYLQAFRLLCQS